MRITEKHLDNYNFYLADFAREALDGWDGSKFSGSLGALGDFDFVDYWTLRKRSLRLFRENIYAKGIIRRLVLNEIHTGLILAPTPVASVIWPHDDGAKRDELGVEYGDAFSTQFGLYANTPAVFDYDGTITFGKFQEIVRTESLICGDGIIISRINRNTKLPSWQWVNGDAVRTPTDYTPRKGNYIRHGVEFNQYGKQVAFHIRQEIDGKESYERVPCRGEKSGRRIAWMVYGSKTLVDDIRGEPFLADTLYMLKDLDRYRDAETRAAVVNAMLVWFIKKNQTGVSGARPTDNMPNIKPGTKFVYRGEDKARLPMKVNEPGTVFDLPYGEEVQSFQTNRPNVNYGTFEGAILAALAWTHDIPPEILLLKFSSNYSASRAANIEFEVYLKRQIKRLSDSICTPIYCEFITQAVLTGQLAAPGFIEAHADGSAWRVIAAWLDCAWIGLSRPAIDREKEIDASQKALDNGLTTFDIESRRACGLSFRQVMATRKRENELMERIGFTPHVYEDNNGVPVTKSEAGNDEE